MKLNQQKQSQQAPEQLTPEIVSTLIAAGGYQNGRTCVELAEKLRVHADGKMPQKLITERRPNESDKIKEYREKIYVPITKRTISKVFSSLEKIRRSQDWSVQFDAEKVSSLIKDDETLEKYCEFHYPHFDSITNWAFSVLLRKYLIDANGIVAVIPEQMPESTTEYVKPVAMFFDSEQIMYYVEGECVVLKSRDTSTYYTHGGRRVNNGGAIYYVLTKNEFAKYEQISAKEFDESCIYRHDIGELPAFKVGGVYHSRKNNDTIYESRIAGMIPSLDEAAREYSDLQAEILQHIHSEKYMFANNDCPVCNGTGQEYIIEQVETKNEQGETVTEDVVKGTKVCHHCHGRGSVSNVSPYGEYVINAAKFGEQQLPTPPIGYVTKSTDIAKFEDEHVRQHIYDALAAINMEFLAETPLSQSGVAKAYDKDELNNFVNAVAEDIVHILDNIYKFINEYRYNTLIANPDDRKAMLPKINVPTKYDILNTSVLMAELKNARDAQAHPMILRELEIDYAKKQFNTDPEIAHMIETTFNLDPLFGMSDESKMTMLQNNGITELDYIVSCNITAFVLRAIREDKDFYSRDYKKQMEVLKKYAEEVQKANEPVNAPTFADVVDNSGNPNPDDEQKDKPDDDKDPKKKPQPQKGDEGDE